MTAAAFIALLLSSAAISLSACDARGRPAEMIDATWFHHIAVERHLARVLDASPTPSGAFHTRFNGSWQPNPKQHYGPTTQGRILYALASGHDLTGNPRYMAELKRGADFMLKRLIDGESGGAFDAVDGDGRVLNPNKRLYGQAFALFGLAHAYRVTGDQRYLHAASSIWESVRVLMRDRAGGFIPGTDRSFTEVGAARNQNPVMHLFEALLALYDATADRMWLDQAGQIVEFVLTRLVQDVSTGSRIPEHYDANWQPMPSEKGGYFDLGHQAEWAWLLSAGAERGLPAYYVETGMKLLDYAIATGYDRGRGGLFWRVDENGKLSRNKIEWVQSEFLRAALRYVRKHGRADLQDEFEQTLAFLRSEFLNTDKGGWYPLPKSECERRGCLDQQGDVGYHLVAMHMEALALAGALHLAPPAR